LALAVAVDHDDASSLHQPALMGQLINLHMRKGIVPRQENYDRCFADVRVKNGFLMAFLEFSTMNGQLNQVLKLSDELIGMVDREVATEAN